MQITSTSSEAAVGNQSGRERANAVDASFARLLDFAAQIANAPIERFDVMDGVTVVRQGAKIGFEGANADKLSFGARRLLLQVFEAGPVASDYLKGLLAGAGHPLLDDWSLRYTIDELKAQPSAGDASTPDASDPAPSTAQAFLEVLYRRILPQFDIHLGDGGRHEATDEVDRVQAGDDAVLNGAGGDDVLAAYSGAAITGGDGNDWIDGYHGLSASGDAGHDVVQAYADANLSGGDGDDRLTAYGNSTLRGGGGNDHLSAYDHAHIEGGDGHDYISAYGHSTVDAGSGNDFISVYDHSTIDAGAGDDFVTAGGHVIVQAGDGNDFVRLGAYADVAAGRGNDSIRIGENAVIRYARGDGVDVIEPRGKGTNIVFGPGITAADVVISREGGDFRIGLTGSGDSLIVRGTATSGFTPRLSFADGTGIAADDVYARATGLPPGGILA